MSKFNVLEDFSTDNNTIQTIARFDRTFSGGIAAPGLGTRIALGGETTIEGNQQIIGSIAAEFVDPTDGVEDGVLLLKPLAVEFCQKKCE